LHLALLAGLSRATPPLQQPTASWTEAVRIIAAPVRPVSALPVLPRLLPATPIKATRAPAPVAERQLHPPLPAATSSPQPPAAAETAHRPEAEPAAAQRSADDIMLQARRDLGGIDKQLRSERPQGIVVAPADSSRRRLDKAFDRAAAAAPGGLLEAPKVEELLDPGGYNRKRYRVVGALGTYCVTYESNHAPDGIDSMQNGIRPKNRTCPAFEQPPTTQP
jgi:hypothetical protein